MSVLNNPSSPHSEKWFWFWLVVLLIVIFGVSYLAAVGGQNEIDLLRRQNDSLTVVLQQREGIIRGLEASADSARAELAAHKAQSDTLGKRMEVISLRRRDIVKHVGSLDDTDLTHRLDTLLGGR
jgi:hypothetical protein